MIFMGPPSTASFATRRDASILTPVTPPFVNTADIVKNSSVVASESMPVVTTNEASTPGVEVKPPTMTALPPEPFYRKGTFWAWLGLVAAVGAGAWAWGRAS